MTGRSRCDCCHELLEEDGTCPVCREEGHEPGGTRVMPRPDLGSHGPIPAEPAAGELVAMPLPDGMAVVVEVVDGPDRGRSFVIRSSGAVIGREEGEVALSDPGVSRRHAVVEVYGSAYVVVKDLSSTNGTFVNGRLVAYSRVADGDEIRVGDTRMILSVERGERPGDTT